MARGKSRGPDGINVEFYLFFTRIKLVIICFMPFPILLNTGLLPNSWGKMYVVLIPKKPNPIYVIDFRPTSLCNVCYKVISKLLANHLRTGYS